MYLNFVFTLSLSDFTDLQQQLNPLSASDNYGIEMYEGVIAFCDNNIT